VSAIDFKNSVDLLKEMVRFVARDSLNFKVDAVCTRDEKGYNDFMPVAV
jgi:hypothetical protein